MKEPVIEKIRIANLHLDLRNFRFEEQHSQKEAIATMIADQKNKLVALAKDIFENGLNPTDLIIVVRLNEGNNQYRVLEGNRRVTCLKLINNPSLIPNEFANIRRQFQRLAANEDRANQLRRPACAIFEYEEEADIWIERKHSGEQDGKGTIAWNSLQKSRYEAFHGAKDSLPLQVVNFINRMAEEDESLKTIANNISNTTNIDRLLSDPYVREKLMLKIQNGRLISFDTKERITKKFVRLIEIVSQPSFTVNYIKHKSDRKIFIDDFYEHEDDEHIFKVMALLRDSNLYVYYSSEIDEVAFMQSGNDRYIGVFTEKPKECKGFIIKKEPVVDLIKTAIRLNKVINGIVVDPYGQPFEIPEMLFEMILNAQSSVIDVA